MGLWIADDEVPEVGYNDVRIKVKKTAICGTDLHIYEWGDWAKKTIPVPMTVGHEFVGIIESVGEGVENYKVGDRVSAEGHITCGYCRNCRAGKWHLCRNTLGVGVNRPGAFAEFVVIPQQNIYLIPEDISDNEAALLDPYGNAVHSALTFDLVGEDVLITGAGPIGLMAAAIARHVGARHVVLTDVNESRLAMATKMGATRGVNIAKKTLSDVIKELGMKEGFDVAMEMSGQPQAFKDILGAMNHGGRIAYLGLPKDEFAIDWNEIIFKSMTISGIYGRRMFETWYKGIGMLQSGLDILPVVTDEYPYQDFEKAFEKMIAGKAGKIILDWS